MAIIFWFIRVKLHIPFHFVSRQNVRYLLLSVVFIPITLGVRAMGFGYIWTSILSVPICCLFYFAALLLMKDETMLFLTNKLLSRFRRSA